MVVFAGLLLFGELAVYSVATIRLLETSRTSGTAGILWMVATGALLGVTADSLLTIGLIMALHRSRTGFKRTDSRIDILIMYSVNTGLLTGLFNLLIVVFAFTEQNTLMYVTAAFVGLKMYATTLLAA
ncbi:hypothetical protein C8Q70DRAFT_1016105 [Cubamyces menziesii]|nr:hypothetical protein C8Q70DRAFT_1016105 [Cubamyces menziesii]